MKVFISHKQEDAISAQRVYNVLKQLGVDSYLDLLDSNIANDGEALTKHIRDALNSCTDILVVMSEQTYHSQWVPFEIGMAAECYMPTVTFLQKDLYLPEFLSFWPRLKNESDLYAYVKARRDATHEIEQSSTYYTMTAENRKIRTTNLFYEKLKAQLKYR